MDINCNQFEGLLSFYINGDLTENMKKMVEEHMNLCPTCSMRYKIVKSIIEDIQSAYNEVITNSNLENEYTDCIEPEYELSEEEIKTTELSAYVDNELSEEECLKLRRNIIAKPKLRKKVEEMYGLKKLISNSFKDQRSRLKSDYSKDIIKSLNSDIKERQIYIHCVMFILFVVCTVAISLITLVHLL